MNQPACKPIYRNTGFSLVEMSVVLIVIGLIISASMNLLPNLLATGKHQMNSAQVEKVRKAVVGFVLANNRLPCPDTGSAPGNAATLPDGEEDITAGVCDADVGFVPFDDLELANADDAFLNTLWYGVYRNTLAGGGVTPYVDLGADHANLGYFCDDLSRAVAAGLVNASLRFRPQGGATADERNQAFVLASGAGSDANQVGLGLPRLLDGLNWDNPLPDELFDDPQHVRQISDPPVASDYDDQVVAVSFNELAGELDCGVVRKQSALSIVTTALPTLSHGYSLPAPYRIEAEGGIDDGAGNYLWCVEPAGASPGSLTLNPGFASDDCINEVESNWGAADALELSGTTAGPAVDSFRVYVRDYSDATIGTLGVDDRDVVDSKRFSITVNAP